MFVTRRFFSTKALVESALMIGLGFCSGAVHAEELVANGDFEAGIGAGWNYVEQEIAIGGNPRALANDGTVDPEGPDPVLVQCQGSQSAFMDQQGPSEQTLFQDIKVPFHVRRADLSWVDRVQSQSPFVAGDQEFRVEIRDQANAVLEVLHRSEANGNACAIRSFNVLKFRGREIRLAFVLVSRNGLINAQIDAVSLEIIHRVVSQPAISPIPDQVVFGRTVLGFGAPVVGPLPFTIRDLHGRIGPVAVSATSDNSSMVEDQDLLVTGSGSQWFISVTDIGQVGSTAEITVDVMDANGKRASTKFTVTSVSGAAIIVDNRSSGFSSTGEWRESAVIDEFSGSSLVSQAIGNSTATFAPELPQAGDYQVLAWWANALPDGRQAARGHDAIYVIAHGMGSDVVRRDQNRNSGQWVELGTYYFSGQEGEGVTVGGRSDGDFQIVSADAIAFVAAGEAALAGDVIVDDSDPGFSATGGWGESGVENEFRGQSLFSYSPEATATWTPNLPQAGEYKVFLWVSRQAREGVMVSRSSSVVYEVQHGNQATRVVVDQNAITSGAWTLLGRFRFDAEGAESVVLLPGSAAYGQGSVSADAFRFSPSNLNTALDVVVDNLDTEFEFFGDWRESSALDEFAGSSVYSTTLGDWACWRLPVAVPGTYQVYVWYSGALSNGRSIRRNSAARYFVQHEGRQSLVEVDQNERTGQWVSLGEFPFAGLENEGVSLQASSLSTSVDAVRFIKVE